VNVISDMFKGASSFKQYLGDWHLDILCIRPPICDIFFDRHNIVYKFTKDRLMFYIYQYKTSLECDSEDIEKNKYELMKYIKQYKEYKYEEYKYEEYTELINKLKSLDRIYE
jgi:hypothetical protein